MSLRHTLPFVCFPCRKSFKIDVEANDKRNSTLTCVEQFCPQCRRAMPFAGRYFKSPPQDNLKQWRKVALLWERGWFTTGNDFHPAVKSLHDAQTELARQGDLEQLQKTRQARSIAELNWSRAIRRRDF